MANAFVHVELSTTDVAKAKDFYGKLFKWELEDVPMGGEDTYTMIKVGEGTGGGLMKQMMPGAPSAWLAYVQVDDIEAATKKAKSLGAKVMKLKGSRVADALVDFAKREGITHVIFGQSARSRWDLLLHGSIVDRFLRDVRNATVQIVPVRDDIDADDDGLDG